MTDLRENSKTPASTLSSSEPLPGGTESSGLAHDPIRIHELHSAEDDFRRRNPVLWASTLYGPPLVTLIGVVLLLVLTGFEFTQRILLSTALALWVLGRFVILSGSDGAIYEIEGPLSSEHLFLLVTWMDVVTALVLAFHIGFLFRTPFVGTRILALVRDGHFILDANPWMKRATFMGLVAFVIFPLTATGSVGGSIFGRLLGMSRTATFYGIVIGSVIGNGIMYVFSESLSKWLDKDHAVIRYGGFVLIALIAIILEQRYRQLKARYEGSKESSAESPSAGESPTQHR